MKAHNLVKKSDPVQHLHKKAIQSLVATSSNNVNSDWEQSTKTIIPHSVDDAHIWCHFIKRVAMLLVF